MQGSDKARDGGEAKEVRLAGQTDQKLRQTVFLHEQICVSVCVHVCVYMYAFVCRCEGQRVSMYASVCVCVCVCVPGSEGLVQKGQSVALGRSRLPDGSLFSGLCL